MRIEIVEKNCKASEKLLAIVNKKVSRLDFLRFVGAYANGGYSDAFSEVRKDWYRMSMTSKALVYLSKSMFSSL